jgi:hypothetical protein
VLLVLSESKNLKREQQEENMMQYNDALLLERKSLQF